MFALWLELMQRIYKASKPKLDFKKFYSGIKSGKIKCPDEWFMMHSIPMEEHEKILTDFFEDKNLSKKEQSVMRFNIMAYGPVFEESKLQP